jgi:hypothetical protein
MISVRTVQPAVYEIVDMVTMRHRFMVRSLDRVHVMLLASAWLPIDTPTIPSNDGTVVEVSDAQTLVDIGYVML